MTGIEEPPLAPVVVLGDAGEESAGADASDSQTSRKSSTLRVTRIAVCLLRLDPSARSMFTVPEARLLSDSVTSRLIATLKADTRVSEVIEAPSAPSFDNARTVPFVDIHREIDDPIAAVERFEALRLNSSIEFRVRVPAKNQPKYRSMDDVPTDEYLVSWDGTVLYVQWTQATLSATASGGHVVLEIVEEIARAAGYEAFIMACSRGCHHRFLHGDFISFDTDSNPDHYHLGGETPTGRGVIAPFGVGESAVDDLRRMRAHLSVLIEQFASAKAAADAILYWGGKARADANSSLRIAYQRASKRPWWRPAGWIVDTWRLTGSARESRRLISGQWLSLASIDSRMAYWDESNRRFTSRLDLPRLEELTELFNTAADEVLALDTTTIRASLQDLASRAEGRSLRFATLIGAGCALIGLFGHSVGVRLAG